MKSPIRIGTLLLVLLTFFLNYTVQGNDEHVKLGDAALAAGHPQEAIDHYSIALKQSPNDISILYKRATVQLSRGRPTEALQDLNTVLSLKPDFVSAILRRGKLYLQMGRFNQASVDFQAVKNLQPGTTLVDDSLATMNRALQLQKESQKYIDSGKTQSALETLKHLLDLIPDDTNARLERASIALQLLNYNLVLEDTMRVLKQDGKSLDALYLRGRALYYLGEKDTAIKFWREGLRYDPENKKCQTQFKNAKKFDKLVEEGKNSIELSEWDKALTKLSAAIEIDPQATYYITSLQLLKCKAYLNLQQGENAIKECTQVLDSEISTNDQVEALILRAEAKLLKSDFDAAIADYRKARELDPRNGRIQQGLMNAEKKLKMSKRKDYYAILGVERNAPSNVIKKAFRKLAMEFHPDRIKVDTEEEKKKVEQRYVELNEAYEVLSDDEKRKRYDSGEDVEVTHQGFPFGFQGGQGGPFTFHFNFG